MNPSRLVLPLANRGHFLGRGSFGEVTRVASLEGRLAVKHLSGQNFGSGELLAEGLRHRCIVHVLGVHHAPLQTTIIMAYGGACTALDCTRRTDFLPKHALCLGVDVVSGVGYLHAQSLVHLDLKLDNVLWCEATARARVADFGCLCRAGFYAEALGAVEWRAPELQCRTPGAPHRIIATPALDLWPLGLLLSCISASLQRDTFAAVSGVLTEIATPMQDLVPARRGCAKEAERSLRRRASWTPRLFSSSTSLDTTSILLSRVHCLDFDMPPAVAKFLPFSAS